MKGQGLPREANRIGRHRNAGACTHIQRVARFGKTRACKDLSRTCELHEGNSRGAERAAGIHRGEIAHIRIGGTALDKDIGRDKLAPDIGLSAHPVNDAQGDILQALQALGYSDKEAAAALKSLPADVGVSEGIKLALKALNK